jgi:hypothetical protein
LFFHPPALFIESFGNNPHITNSWLWQAWNENWHGTEGSMHGHWC